MAKQEYRYYNFTPKSLALIATIDRIVESYREQGFRLTVRQIYYQLVARNIIPNTERSYKNTTELCNNARLAGLLDWDAIEDRTRAFIRRQRWDSAKQILQTVVKAYHMDMWENQQLRPFVIIEKEALVGILEPVCYELDTPLLAARGYPSISVIREFVETDLLPCVDTNQGVVIIHLGDHDPSGIDMSRDLDERIAMLCGEDDLPIVFERIALNMEQVDHYKPPPNPAKVSDSRFVKYQRKYGHDSWELDALQPSILVDLVRNHILGYCDDTLWAKRKEEIEQIRAKLKTIADNAD